MTLPLILAGIVAVAWIVMRLRGAYLVQRRLIDETVHRHSPGEADSLLRDEYGHVVCDEAGMPVKREIES